MILWRAAKDDYVSDSCSFAETREAAELYMNNPGFGGNTLWTADVEICEYLDLTEADAMERLQAVLGSDHDFGAIGIDELVPRLAHRLCEAGVQWVKVCESYPADSTTWIYVGGGLGDEPTLVEAE